MVSWLCSFCSLDFQTLRDHCHTTLWIMIHEQYFKLTQWEFYYIEIPYTGIYTGDNSIQLGYACDVELTTIQAIILSIA